MLTWYEILNIAVLFWGWANVGLDANTLTHPFLAFYFRDYYKTL